jgi:hypothetical protein
MLLGVFFLRTNHASYGHGPWESLLAITAFWHLAFYTGVVLGQFSFLKFFFSYTHHSHDLRKAWQKSAFQESPLGLYLVFFQKKKDLGMVNLVSIWVFFLYGTFGENDYNYDARQRLLDSRWLVGVCLHLGGKDDVVVFVGYTDTIDHQDGVLSCGVYFGG